MPRGTRLAVTRFAETSDDLVDAFFIVSSFFTVYVSGADESDEVASLREGYQEKAASARMPNDDLTTLRDGMSGVIMNSRERISEDAGCLLEGNAVLPKVLTCLSRVPGELHPGSLRQKASTRAFPLASLNRCVGHARPVLHDRSRPTARASCFSGILLRPFDTAFPYALPALRAVTAAPTSALYMRRLGFYGDHPQIAAVPGTEHQRRWYWRAANVYRLSCGAAPRASGCAARRLQCSRRDQRRESMSAGVPPAHRGITRRFSAGRGKRPADSSWQ